MKKILGILIVVCILGISLINFDIFCGALSLIILSIGLFNTRRAMLGFGVEITSMKNGVAHYIEPEDALSIDKVVLWIVSYFIISTGSLLLAYSLRNVPML